MHIRLVGGVIPAILPMSKWLLPMSYFLCVTDFLKVKLSRENFHGYVKKKKRITHDSYRGKFYGLIKTQSGPTKHEKLKCAKL